MKYLIFLLSLLSCVQISCVTRNSKEITTRTKERGIWNEALKTYIDTERNLQWDLSLLENWRIAEEYRLPENMLFTAANDDYGICVSIAVVPFKNGEKNTSIWEAPEEYINGMKESFAAQAGPFPGVKYNEPVSKKIHYLFKEALLVGFDSKVSDYRGNVDEIIPFSSRMIAFVLNNEIIQVYIMAPQFLIDEYGEDVYEVIFRKFGYIDATKEVSN